MQDCTIIAAVELLFQKLAAEERGHVPGSRIGCVREAKRRAEQDRRNTLEHFKNFREHLELYQTHFGFRET